MFYVLLYVTLCPFYFAIILMGKRELVALLGLYCWCLVIVVWLFLGVPWVCLQFVIVVFPDHTHLLFPNTKICFPEFFSNYACHVTMMMRCLMLKPKLTLCYVTLCTCHGVQPFFQANELQTCVMELLLPV